MSESDHLNYQIDTSNKMLEIIIDRVDGVNNRLDQILLLLRQIIPQNIQLQPFDEPIKPGEPMKL